MVGKLESRQAMSVHKDILSVQCKEKMFPVDTARASSALHYHQINA